MAERVTRRMRIIQLLAEEDSRYRSMLRENAELERKYTAAISELPPEQMDIICDFLTHCEAMSDRMLELACTYMRFSE